MIRALLPRLVRGERLTARKRARVSAMMRRTKAAGYPDRGVPLRRRSRGEIGRGAARRGGGAPGGGRALSFAREPSSTHLRTGGEGLTPTTSPPRPRWSPPRRGFRLRSTETAPYRAARERGRAGRRSAPYRSRPARGCGARWKRWITFLNGDDSTLRCATWRARGGSRHPDPLNWLGPLSNPTHATHPAGRRGGGGRARWWSEVSEVGITRALSARNGWTG